MRSWSAVKKLASTLPRISPRYLNSSSRVLGKPAGQLLRVVHVEAQELVLRRALQADHLQVLVLGHRAPDELQLEARLALEVEDLLAAVAAPATGTSCWLFSAIGSPGWAARRGSGRCAGPASEAVRWTRAAADSPSAGSVISCDWSTRPASSTWSWTFCAAQPALGHADLGGDGRALEHGRGQLHARELDVLARTARARGRR